MATGHLRMGYRQLLPSLRPPFDALPRWLTHLSTDHLPPPTTLSSVTFRGLLVDLPGAGGGDGWQMGACERAGGCVFLAGFVQKKNQNHQNWKSLACFKGQKIIHHFTLVNRKLVFDQLVLLAQPSGWIPKEVPLGFPLPSKLELAAVEPPPLLH